MKQNRTLDQDVVSAVREILKDEYLRESNLLNLLPTAVCVSDASGAIINYNRKAEKLWGISPQKNHGNQRFGSAANLYYPDGRTMPYRETGVYACITYGLPQEDIEMVIERPDQSRVVVKESSEPIKDEQGNLLGVVSCFYDITEQKKTQKELDWKTRELRDYVDNAAVSLHWVDGDGIIKWANSAELDMLGYTENEYVGHHISEFHVQKEKIEEILNRLSCNEVLNQYQSELRCKDGSVKTVQITSNVFWHDGKFIHTRCFTIDVTEEKKLFNALKESESKYRQLIHSLQTPLYTTDAEGIITYYNEAAVHLWGRTPQVGKDRWSGSLRVFNLDGQEIALEDAPLARCLREKRSISGQEIIIERPDGTRRSVVPYPTPLYDAKGGLSGAINVIIDITDRKNIEKALRESESQYRQLIQGLPVAVYTTDSDGRITLYNRAAAELWGREPEIGKDLWCGSFKIFKSDGTDVPLDTCPMAVCLTEQRAVYGEELLVMRPDGSIRNVAPHPQPLLDASGKIIGAINMLVDITEIKRTGQALRESEAEYRELAFSLERKVEEKTLDITTRNEELKKSEERYHKMVEEVEDYAIILLDKDGVIQNWNKGAEKIKGYSEAEIIGKSFSNFYMPEDRESGFPQKLLKQATENGKAIHEGWRMRKDGSRFWGSIVLTALHDDENNILGFSKVTRDLTERKLSEDRIKEYNRQLEFQNRELEQFAYAASHDMKEPLRKIHLYNSSISENPSNVLDEKSREYLNRSINAARRMNNLIDDLLAYSRTTSNFESIEQVDLNEVFEEIVLLHKEEFEQKRVHVEMEHLPVVYAVPFQVKQLMFNLVNNSIKYKNPERDLCIQLKSELVNGSEIKQLEAEPKRKYQKISVIDNGIGFEPQYAEKIFDIFQRLNNVPGTKGSGIGLAICKRILQNHHGFISATGKLNEGARFDIYLPADL